MGEDRLIIIPIGIAIVHKKQDLIVRAVVSTRKIIFCYGREMRAGYCVFSHRIYVSRERATEEDEEARRNVQPVLESLCIGKRRRKSREESEGQAESEKPDEQNCQRNVQESFNCPWDKKSARRVANRRRAVHSRYAQERDHVSHRSLGHGAFRVIRISHHGND